jgi:hypothetical protein
MKPTSDWRPGRELYDTLGSDWLLHPPIHWGRKDVEQAHAMGKPVNATLPPAPPERTIPSGFSLYPDRQRPPLSKGERAVAEIRGKLGLRR